MFSCQIVSFMLTEVHTASKQVRFISMIQVITTYRPQFKKQNFNESKASISYLSIARENRPFSGPRYRIPHWPMHALLSHLVLCHYKQLSRFLSLLVRLRLPLTHSHLFELPTTVWLPVLCSKYALSQPAMSFLWAFQWGNCTYLLSSPQLCHRTCLANVM